MIIKTLCLLTMVFLVSFKIAQGSSGLDNSGPSFPDSSPVGVKIKWLQSTFNPWLTEQRQKGNPITEIYTGTSLLQAKNFLNEYNSNMSRLQADKSVAAAASAIANRALQAEKEQTEARLRIETARREEAERRHRLEEAAKVLAEQRQREEEEAHRQSRIREEAAKAEKRIVEQQVSEARQRLDHLMETVRHSGTDTALLDAVLPPMQALSATAVELRKKSRSLATFLEGYIFLLDEIKENESAGEQAQKDYMAIMASVYSGIEVFSSAVASKVENAVEITRGIYALARRYKETLPSDFERFKENALRRATDAGKYEEFMVNILLTPVSDALERLDGKDSLQLSLDASATFQNFLKSLTEKGACAPDLVTPVSREINEAIKRILAEIKKRNLELRAQYESSLTSEVDKVRRLSAVRKLNELPFVVHLFEYPPVLFLLIDTNPSLEDLKEDLSKLTIPQLKALFSYLFDLSDQFRNVAQRYAELSHTRTKVSESDIQELTGIVKTRIQQAEKAEDYQPDLNEAGADKQQKITLFRQKAADLVSGKSYRETVTRRFLDVYTPLASFIASCQKDDLEAFKAEKLSQRGAKGPIDETDDERDARQSLIDRLISFQEDSLALDTNALNNNQLTVFTQQFSDIKAAVDANGERFKTNLTAFLKRKNPDYKPPTQAIISRPSSAASLASLTSRASSTTSLASLTPSDTSTYSGPSFSPPLRVVVPTPSVSVSSSSSSAAASTGPVDPKKAMQLELENAGALRAFAKTLIDGTDKTNWKKATIFQKVEWMKTGINPLGDVVMLPPRPTPPPPPPTEAWRWC